MRKIIQVATASTETETILIALCDDGTLWNRKLDFMDKAGNMSWSSWRQIDPAPQKASRYSDV